MATCAALQFLDVSNNVSAQPHRHWQPGGANRANGSYNQLTEVTGLGSCAALVKLNLSNNAFTSMDDLATLTHVTEIDVSYNDILTIPDFRRTLPFVTFNLAATIISRTSAAWPVSTR